MSSLGRNYRIVRILTQNITRNYSVSAPLVDVAVNDKTGVATVSLQRLPVNSLNVELVSEINTALTDLEKNKSRGMILTSSAKSVFSAGIDIREMYQPKEERVKTYWSLLQDTWIKLYGSSFPTVAVINGHSPAGGCLLAMSCEYRVMLNNFTIGLNETQLGIIAPGWFIASMQNTIGLRQTEISLTTGALYKTEDALKIGLIDEIANSKDEGIKKAEAFLARFARIPPIARMLTKQSLRGKDIKALADNKEADLKHFVMFTMDPKVQKGLGLYLEGLKQKQK